ncbi:hypothetical protein AOQ84DRAFT_409163 [Glonium stellatum]|uniref:CorA-like transporter domain-containing protein n=1 Tax=Glonium stellatum TaxID=574774 RepID=A0A8E2EZ57_9PEZI|nr:hypothetical protein AOQ84DRAFT_409163 [Glonium stellatum]
MLLLILSYHQVIPSFLEFIFPYGRQQYAQDFHFSGSREENRLAETEGGVLIPELGRSGRDIRLCYNLKSAEPSNGQKGLPWSTRQTAVYHSFDIETGQAFWMIVKGDKLMRDRITSTMESLSRQDPNLFDETTQSFTSSLAAHLIVCEWGGEHWRWYIGSLEEQLQDMTGRTLAVKVHKPSQVPTETRTFSPQALSRRTTSAQMNASLVDPNLEKKTSFSSHRTLSWLTKKSMSPSLQTRPEPTYSPPSHTEQQTFSFSDLQQTQFVKEKANEALLVLRANRNVLQELKQHYRSFTDSEYYRKHLGTGCTDKLYGILEYQNMQVNTLLAEKARLSAEHMETMTSDMHVVAWKTKQETVSMKIITLVTLFFLPGTFISTFMSAGIVEFLPASTDSASQKKIVSRAALKLFMVISVPLMVLTFTTWYAVYWWHDRKEKLRQKRLETEGFKSPV